MNLKSPLRSVTVAAVHHHIYSETSNLSLNRKEPHGEIWQSWNSSTTCLDLILSWHTLSTALSLIELISSRLKP